MKLIEAFKNSFILWTRVHSFSKVQPSTIDVMYAENACESMKNLMRLLEYEWWIEEFFQKWPWTIISLSSNKRASNSMDKKLPCRGRERTEKYSGFLVFRENFTPFHYMNNRREVVSAFEIAATWRQLASQLFFHGVPFRQKAALLIYLLPYNLSLLIWELQSGSVTLFLHCCRRCSVHGICPCKIFELELIHTRMKIMLSM